MSTVQEDIQRILTNEDLFTYLADSKVMITGATGLIGSMLARTFVAANEKYSLNIKIIGQIRNYEKATIVLSDVLESLDLVTTYDAETDYIIHTVSPTTSKYFIENPVETIQTSVLSTMTILEAAKKSGATVVYLSSMEQYGIPYESGQKMTEDQVGIINHLNIRSSYSESKRICECLCSAYAHEYGVNVKIARLAQTFGAGVSLTDNRMPMQFAKSVVNGTDIVLHTEGKSISNYVYLSDAITGILTIMKCGEIGQAYNVCNDKETKSVYDIARLVANQVAEGRIKVVVEKKDNLGYAPDVVMYLDSSKLRMLGWKAEIDMVEAYKRLARYIHEVREE